MAKTRQKGPLTDLWQRYRRERSITTRNQLVEHYLPLAHAQAAPLANRLRGHVTFEEVCSAAYEGLIHAVEAYDPRRGVSFNTFASPRIRGAVFDWIRARGDQTRTLLAFDQQRYKAEDYLAAADGERPTDIAVARRMGLSYLRFAKLSRWHRRWKCLHKFTVRADAHGIEDDQQDSVDPKDTKSQSPGHDLQRADSLEFYTRGLSQEERLVLLLYYGEDWLMREVAVGLDVSESRVSQLRSSALAKLRERFAGWSMEQLAAAG